MFSDANAFNQPMNTWDTTKVTDMTYIFAYSNFDQPLSNWNTDLVTSLFGMFSNCPFNQDVSMFNTANVITFVSLGLSRRNAPQFHHLVR